MLAWTSHSRSGAGYPGAGGQTPTCGDGEADSDEEKQQLRRRWEVEDGWLRWLR